MVFKFPAFMQKKIELNHAYTPQSQCLGLNNIQHIKMNILDLDISGQGHHNVIFILVTLPCLNYWGLKQNSYAPYKY